MSEVLIQHLRLQMDAYREYRIHGGKNHLGHSEKIPVYSFTEQSKTIHLNFSTQVSQTNCHHAMKNLRCTHLM